MPKAITDELTHQVKFLKGEDSAENRLNSTGLRLALNRILAQKIEIGQYKDYLIRIRNEDSIQVFEAQLDTIKLTPLDNKG